MSETTEQMLEDAKQVRAYIEKMEEQGAWLPRSIRYVVDEDGNRVDPSTYWENGPDSRDAT